VEDRGRGQEAVEEGLDRRPRAAGILEGEAEIVDHLGVAHVLARKERLDVVHADAGKILPLNDLEVGPRTLHAEHAALAAAVIPLGLLDGGVAPAPHDQRGLGADQPGRVDEKVEPL
jgi:hypothetical protein